MSNSMMQEFNDQPIDQCRHLNKQKVRLGELALRAGLDRELTSVILGLMLEAKERLCSKEGNHLRRQWWVKGEKWLSQS